MSRFVIICLLYLGLLCVFPSVSAARLPFISGGRYMFAGASYDQSQQEFAPVLDIFTGDFPFLFRVTNQELSFYTGFPLHRPAPFYLSFGTENQFGFYDAYRTRTFFQSGSVGFTLQPFEETVIDPFISGSARFDQLTAGWTYYENSRRIIGEVTASTSAFTLFGNLEYSFTDRHLSDWEVGVDLRSRNKYGLRVSLDSDLAVTAAVGISRRSLPADAVSEYDWDFFGAHRGSMELYPENSLESFNYAKLRPEISFIETDLSITSDGDYVVVHDPLLFRYTGELNFLDSLPADELMERDMGSYFSREFSHVRMLDVEQLADFFDHEEGIHLMIELKFIGNEEDTVEKLTDAVEEHFQEGNYSYITLVHEHAEHMADLPEGIKWGFIYLNYPPLPLLFMLHSNIYQLLEFELDSIRTAYDPDFIIMLMNSLVFYDRLRDYGREHGLDILFWDLKDTMYGITPDGGKTPTFLR